MSSGMNKSCSVYARWIESNRRKLAPNRQSTWRIRASYVICVRCGYYHHFDEVFHAWQIWLEIVSAPRIIVESWVELINRWLVTTDDWHEIFHSRQVNRYEGELIVNNRPPAYSWRLWTHHCIVESRYNSADPWFDTVISWQYVGDCPVKTGHSLPVSNETFNETIHLHIWSLLHDKWFFGHDCCFEITDLWLESDNSSPNILEYRRWNR